MMFLSRRLLLLAPAAMAGCGDDVENEPPPPRPRARPPRPAPEEQPPLRYSYLPPINLKVARLDIGTDFTAPDGDGEVSGSSSVRPEDALKTMARDRLKTSGGKGIATFQIQTASIARKGTVLSGVLAVRLDLRGGDNDATGFAEARVTANKTGPIADQRAAVYDMTKSMMDDMNVELEFQIRKELKAWLVEPKQEPARG